MTRDLHQTTTHLASYHRARNASRARARRSALALCVVLSLPSQLARGHPAPADPPQFQDGPCVVTVNLAAQSTLELPYHVAADDRVLSEGDIPVPDAKTHQFFAFRGALFPIGFNYELQPFDPPGAPATELPLWISADDVKRAAQASGDASGTTFSEADVPSDAVLDHHPQLTGQWLRITPDDARLPITISQSLLGTSWDLDGVAPGLYTIAVYIFSPPYNGWAVRPGLVRVLASADDASAMPAMVVEPVQGVLFGYQGRRVRACAEGAEGLRVHAFYKDTDVVDSSWESWSMEPASIARTSELCFRSPQPALSGSVRLRFDLETGASGTLSFYTPDTLTALAGQGACVPSDSICCDGAPPVVSVATCEAADACVDAGPTPVEPPDSGSRAEMPAVAETEAEPAPAAPSNAGCTLVRARAPSSCWALAPSALLVVARLIRRRRRRRGARSARVGTLQQLEPGSN